MTRTRCGACGRSELVPFLDLGETPLANTLPATRETVETYYLLGLTRCPSCSLVQNTADIPDEVIYGEEYAFYSGGSQAQREYQQRAAELLLDQHYGLAHRSTVEVACNDGTLLTHLAKAGCNVLGVDPSVPVELAIENGLDAIRAPFTAELAREIRDERRPAGLVIAYNVLAHVNDLGDMLDGIRELLADDGVAVVEMQYLPDLLVGNAIGQVYHEHRYFWSLTSFSSAAGLHGLYVADAELIEHQGGGMRVTLSRLPGCTSARAVRILDSEVWLSRGSAYENVQSHIDRNRDHFLDIVQAERDAYRVVVGYAASAKACTILNYYDLDLPYVIDATPTKWGRFVPGVKIPIVGPHEAPRHDTRFLLTSNYLGWLLRNDQFTSSRGRWLIAEPLPMVV